MVGGGGGGALGESEKGVIWTLFWLYSWVQEKGMRSQCRRRFFFRGGVDCFDKEWVEPKALEITGWVRGGTALVLLGAALGRGISSGSGRGRGSLTATIARIDIQLVSVADKVCRSQALRDNHVAHLWTPRRMHSNFRSGFRRRMSIHHMCHSTQLCLRKQSNHLFHLSIHHHPNQVCPCRLNTRNTSAPFESQVSWRIYSKLKKENLH